MPEFKKGVKIALFVAGALAALVVVAIFAGPADAPRGGGNEPEDHASARLNTDPLNHGACEPAPGSNTVDEPTRSPEVTRPSHATDDSTALEAPACAAVDGQVVDATTGEGVPDATIWLHFATTVRTLAVLSAADGGFRIQLPDWAVLEDASDLTVKCAGYEKLVAKPVARTNRLELYRETLVIVSLADTLCIPASTWLKWPGTKWGSEPGAELDMATGEARVAVKQSDRQPGACVARCDWLGRLVESAPFEVNWGGTTRVELSPPAGASVTVRVIGPDSLPMKGVGLSIGQFMDEPMRAQTDETGRASFTGIAAPTEIEINVEGSVDMEFCVAPLKAVVSGVGDHTELLLDLTGTGIVDCVLAAGGEILYALVIQARDDNDKSPWQHATLRRKGDQALVRRVYGLAPGWYRVMASHWDHSAVFTAEFEVQPPPAISEWHRSFETINLTVRVTGAPSTKGMVLHQWGRGRLVEATFSPNQDGNFVITGLSSGKEFFIRVSGGGYASRVVSVNPKATSELELPVEASGTVHLVRRDGGDVSALIRCVVPREDRYFTEGLGATFELPAGVYHVEDFYGDGPPWPGDEFTVVAGEEVTCEIGPPFTCTLQVRVKDRTELWDLNPEVRQNGEIVPCNIVKTGRVGDQYQEFYFCAEGKFMLRLRSYDIEPFEQEFTVSRGETVPLEIELKQKE